MKKLFLFLCAPFLLTACVEVPMGPAYPAYSGSTTTANYGTPAIPAYGPYYDSVTTADNGWW